MSSVYTVYHIGCEIPGSDVYSNSYEIYDSEEDFLEYLASYIDYAKSCVCDVDEDDEDAMNQWFEDCCYDKEGYEAYTELITEKTQNISINNGLYQQIFSCFDIYIDIFLVTNDYKKFIDTIHEDFMERAGLDDNTDEHEIEYVYDHYPVLRYTIPLRKSGHYPTEKEFLDHFEDYQDSINEGALSFNV